ncbi:MAG: hypothetical protein PVI21_05520 [Candidatus Woesebacteria bacterium]|jgi:hypothetical protein
MTFFAKPYNFKNKQDIISFFNEALLYRQSHKNQSEKIACFVFDTTHESKIGLLYNKRIDTIRNEFGALEAPGLPDNNQDPDEFADYLWSRLGLLVKEA